MLAPMNPRWAKPGQAALTLAIVAVLTLLPINVFAEDETKFSGRVLDSNGVEIQNATLLVFSPTANARSVTTSDDRGRFEFNLPPGDWMLDVYASGFSRLNLDNVKLEARKDLTQDIRLTTGATTLASAEPPLRVSPNLLNGSVLFRPTLKYPEEAKARRVSGTVTIEAIIGTDGTVFPLHMLNRNIDPLLGRAAVEYVVQHRYDPYTANGRPVQVITVFTINFTFQ